MSQLEQMKLETMEQLQERHDQLTLEIFKLTSELKVMRKIEHPHRLNFLKKERARVLTIMNQKNRGDNE